MKLAKVLQRHLAGARKFVGGFLQGEKRVAEDMYKDSAGFVSLLVNTLIAEGLDALDLGRRAGLDMQRLDQPDAFFDRLAVYRLLELAAQQSGDPNIGLKTYAHFQPGCFQLVGYVMMSSHNLKEALQRLVYFVPLLGSGFSMTFGREAAGYRLAYCEHPERGVRMPRQYQDAGSAALLGFCRWLTGGNLPRPLAIEFDYPEPEEVTEHQRLFDCPLRFGMERFSLLLDAEELLAPLSTANEALAVLHENFAEARLNLLYGSSLVARVRALITECLASGPVDMEGVARALCVSKRTLQRGLKREGAQFKDILNEVRHRLADYYLRHSSQSLAQVAELLGYQEQSSFHKACLRWFGSSPGRYRADQAALAANATQPAQTGPGDQPQLSLGALCV
jgi:AraC-like DNA-binding protein